MVDIGPAPGPGTGRSIAPRLCLTAMLIPYRHAYALPPRLCFTATLMPYRHAYTLPPCLLPYGATLSGALFFHARFYKRLGGALGTWHSAIAVENIPEKKTIVNSVAPNT